LISIINQLRIGGTMQFRRWTILGVILLMLFAGFVSAQGQGFEETFDKDFWDRGWEKRVIAGNPDGFFYNLGKKRLSFNLPGLETNALVINPKVTAADIKVEATFENIHSTVASYSVICRASEDGWYEFRIYVAGPEGGSYKVYKYDSYLKEQFKTPYVILHPGMDRFFTNDIKLGLNKKNKIGLICEGESIRIFINDKEQFPVKYAGITDSDFTEGGIGFGVQSYSEGIVDVDIIKFTAEKPTE
jgi:hypothetical protein